MTGLKRPAATPHKLLKTALLLGLSPMLLSGATAPAWAQPAPALLVGASGLAMDEVVIQTGPESAARAAPLVVPGAFVGPGRALSPPGPGGPSAASAEDDNVSARNGETPDGITPLERDIFSTDDFYLDRDLWSDQRYWRCASPQALENIQGAFGPSPGNGGMGDNPPATVSWGHCDRDLPREAMVSPYGFETAQQQYEALLAEAEARGGPTIHTAADLPDWNGVYASSGFMQSFSGSSWWSAATMQVPTYLSLLTPEYQQRFVQQSYHYAKTNAPQWPGSYCWPEGFLRRFEPGFDRWVLMTPQLVQTSIAISETTTTHINVGREFTMDGAVPYLGVDTRRWFGETVGFWDGDILITWTSNIQGWTAHGKFEFSNSLQSIEIYTPITDGNGKFVGLNHEIVLYDPEALVEPVRFMENWEWGHDFNTGAPFEWRECIQTLFPLEGYTRPANPGDTIEFTIPDMFDRPWARIWEKYFEAGMQRPQENDVLAGFD